MKVEFWKYRGYDVSGDICGQQNDKNPVSGSSGKNLENNK